MNVNGADVPSNLQIEVNLIKLLSERSNIRLQFRLKSGGYLSVTAGTFETGITISVSCRQASSNSSSDLALLLGVSACCSCASSETFGSIGAHSARVKPMGSTHT